MMEKSSTLVSIKPAQQKPNNTDGGASEINAVEAESLLLGVLLREQNALEHCEGLEADHFYHSAHNDIFRVLQRHFFNGHGYDVEALKHSLGRIASVEGAGGSDYIVGLLKAGGSTTAVRHYSKLVRDAYVRRQMVRVCDDSSAKASDEEIEEEPSELLEELEQKLFNIAEKGFDDRRIIDFSQASNLALKEITEARKRRGQMTGVSTGFKYLDSDLAGGLHRSDLIILAGRPGMGKTAFATTIAVNAARAWKENKENPSAEPGGHVLFFSLEMSAEQLSARILTSAANVEGMAIRSGKISTQEYDKLSKCADELSSLPLFIDDSGGHSISNILQRGRRFKRRNKGRLGLVIVDYLQLLSAPAGSSQANKVQQVTEITRMLKLIAKELQVPVLALSQLSRELEKRGSAPGVNFGDYRPQLADLRESGSIEQDADIVMFIHRDEYYIERHKPTRKDNESEDDFKTRINVHAERLENVRGRADIIIAKHRHGSTGKVELGFDAEHTLFTDTR